MGDGDGGTLWPSTCLQPPKALLEIAASLTCCAHRGLDQYGAKVDIAAALSLMHSLARTLAVSGADAGSPQILLPTCHGTVLKTLIHIRREIPRCRARNRIQPMAILCRGRGRPSAPPIGKGASEEVSGVTSPVNRRRFGHECDLKRSPRRADIFSRKRGSQCPRLATSAVSDQFKKPLPFPGCQRAQEALAGEQMNPCRLSRS